MRSLLVLVVLLMATAGVFAIVSPAATGSADVFVPADPPPRAAECADAAGDIVASRRYDRRYRPILTVTAASGRWQRRLARDGDTSCPRVVAAADGTAVIVAGSRAFVRRSGAGFGSPVPLGRRIMPLGMAAAPGGWVAVVTTREPDRELVATILAPDGTSASAVLDRVGPTGRVLAADVGIDAHGAVTAAWTRAQRRSQIRIARATDGTWAPARTIAAVDRWLDGEVAVAPGGQTLIAWADGRGVRVSADGRPGQRVTSERPMSPLTAAIDDDGAAVIAYSAGRDVHAVDRESGGAWSSPHSLSTLPAPDWPALRSVVAADGRSVVTWTTYIDGRERVLAAAGRAGGEWTAATALSSITRDARLPSLSLGATGDPQLTWVESGGGLLGTGRLQGARLAPAAEAGPSDLSPPILATHLPRSTRRTRTGVVRFRVPVRCSETCDARLRLIDARTGVEVAGATRELAAGRGSVLRLRTPGFFAHALLIERRARRPRLEVLVSDRAGNVARRSGVVRVRVAQRSLLSFRVAADHDFAMFTRAGNRAVARLVNDLIGDLAAGEIHSFKDLRRRYLRGERAIVEQGHDEIYDTEVRDEIFDVLEVPLALSGYDAESLLSA